MKRILAFSTILPAIAAFAVGAGVSSQGRTQELANQHKIIARTRQNTDEFANKDAHPGGGANPRKGNGISYHGGPLLGVVGSSPVVVYYIWYGNWSGNTATTILTDLAGNISLSPYFTI